MRGKNRFCHMSMQSGIPEDAWGCGTRVTMMGKSCVLAEGHQGVVELSPDRIRLRTNHGIISILGSGLELRELSVDAALVHARQAETVTYAGMEGR